MTQFYCFIKKFQRNRKENIYIYIMYKENEKKKKRLREKKYQRIIRRYI